MFSPLGETFALKLPPVTWTGSSSFDPRNLKKTITHELLTAEDEQFDNESYRTKLQLKDIIISKLESELEKMKEFHDTVLKTKGNTQGDFEVPKNYEELYHKLVDKIQSTEAELNDTKLRLESLVTAISMNPNPTNYKNGRYDEQEVSHKIISKLKLLSEENEELSRMLSYGKSKEKDIEIALLRKQNNDLLEKVSKLEAKLNDTK
ncbi:Protein MUM2 [Pichia kudriavzevii]|uniref:Protein MUM2 n=1 Tax=Pichia kudriavzevii TaxID=4909 RepID=A0A1V2LM47_PICKU|nr:Protein MUM2 [Pichia kudriavzevii]